MKVTPCLRILMSFLFVFSNLAHATTSYESHLNWADILNPNSSEKTRSLHSFSRILKLAKSSLDLDFPVKSVLYLQGEWENEEEHDDSKDVVKTFPSLFSLALCARLAEKPLKTKCDRKVHPILLSWARSYVPTGNPISEGQFIPLFQAFDLMNPLLNSADRSIMSSFLRQFIHEGDLLFEKIQPEGGRLTNNWQTWRLLIRAVAATIINDRDIISSTKILLKNHVQNNIGLEGATVDFDKRDALHYQVYDLEAWVQLKAFTPFMLDINADQQILRGLQFLKPFYTGQSKHIEFVKSAVEDDLRRKEAGIAAYQNMPWKPRQARHLLRLSRPLFPQIKEWTQSAVDEEYPSSIKFLAEIYGETQERSVEL